MWTDETVDNEGMGKKKSKSGSASHTPHTGPAISILPLTRKCVFYGFAEMSFEMAYTDRKPSLLHLPSAESIR